jgi:hypothetical protein
LGPVFEAGYPDEDEERGDEPADDCRHERCEYGSQNPPIVVTRVGCRCW